MLACSRLYGVTREAIDREREEQILKVYGSKKTYETLGNFDLNPPPSYWEIIEEKQQTQSGKGSA